MKVFIFTTHNPAPSTDFFSHNRETWVRPALCEEKVSKFGCDTKSSHLLFDTENSALVVLSC